MYDLQELSTPCATRFVVDVSQSSVVFLDTYQPLKILSIMVPNLTLQPCMHLRARI